MKADWDAERDPLAALRDGDASLFEAFVRTEVPTFLAFFRRLGAGPEEAEDLTQETLLKMHHSAQRYQPRERFPAYALLVARNAWIDHRRRAGVRPVEAAGTGSTRDGAEAEEDRLEPEPHALRIGAAPETDVSEALAGREVAQRIRAAVRELPEHHRSVFELGVVQELRYEEIARLLDVPVGTVKSRMFHAVRRLRLALAPEHEVETRGPAAAEGGRA